MGIAHATLARRQQDMLSPGVTNEHPFFVNADGRHGYRGELAPMPKRALARPMSGS
jgi:hypothetical protein